MPSPFHAATLFGAPSFPNAIAWSEENLIAVASGHLITILGPAVPLGPRGLVTVSSTEPPFIGIVDRKEGHQGHLKIYRLPFSNFSAEWIEVVDITERLYDYLICRGLGDMGIHSSGRSTMQEEKKRSADGMPNAVSRKGQWDIC